MSLYPRNPRTSPHQTPSQGYSVAVVGCGRFGRNWLRVLDAHDDVAALYGVDPSAEALDLVQCNYPSAICRSSLDSLESSLDVAVIAAPSAAHGDIAERLLASGVHLLVEKPFAANSAQARKLIELATIRDVALAVGHQMLAHPFFNTLEEHLLLGRLGRPLSIESVRRGPLAYGADRDVLDAFAPHELSMICALAKEDPLSMHSRVERDSLGRIELAAIDLVFPSGLRASTTVGVQDTPERGLDVRGTDGTARFVDDRTMPSLELSGGGETIRLTGPLAGDQEPLKREADRFFSAVRFGDAARDSAKLGLLVTQILERVVRSKRIVSEGSSSRGLEPTSSSV